MRITKVISTAIEKGRLIVKILGLGGKDVQTCYAVMPFGIDSNPSKDYRAIYSFTDSSNEKVMVGIINKEVLTQQGELVLFSEDSNGAKAFKIYLNKDGICELGGNADFAVRFSELQGGFNQLKSDLNSLITTFNTHVHTGVTTGPGSSGPTATPGTSSAASIDAAKIDNIKTS